MRVVFCGSGTFATPTLSALLASGHEVALAVTQPPRPAGRGGKLRATPVEEQARSAGLGVLACEDINAPASEEHLRKVEPDVICVVEYGQFIRSSARQTARLGAMNLHASILPNLRGAAPVNWAIIRGLRRTGVSTFQLVDQMDAGPVYRTAELQIGPDERAQELRKRLAELGAQLVLETLDLLAAGKLHGQPQDDSRATFAPRLLKSDGFLDFRVPAEHIVWKVRGTWPWPGARAVFGHAGGGAVPVTITKARVAEGPARSASGLVDEDLCVSTADGRLEIIEIQPAGRRVMSWRDFVNGHRVSAGDMFNLPENDEP
jgi:methionyl-tRNA formyltransferase